MGVLEKPLEGKQLSVYLLILYFCPLCRPCPLPHQQHPHCCPSGHPSSVHPSIDDLGAFVFRRRQKKKGADLSKLCYPFYKHESSTEVQNLLVNHDYKAKSYERQREGDSRMRECVRECLPPLLFYNLNEKKKHPVP
jgi:hypothetical protein